MTFDESFEDWFAENFNADGTAKAVLDVKSREELTKLYKENLTELYTDVSDILLDIVEDPEVTEAFVFTDEIDLFSGGDKEGFLTNLKEAGLRTTKSDDAMVGILYAVKKVFENHVSATSAIAKD